MRIAGTFPQRDTSAGEWCSPLYPHGALLVVGLAADRVELVVGEAVGAALVPVKGDEDLAGAHDRRDPDADRVDRAATRAHPNPVSAADAQVRSVARVHLDPCFRSESLEDRDPA